MSYSHEDVCIGTAPGSESCGHARIVPGWMFWDGQPRFAKCAAGHEQQVDLCAGECPHRQSVFAVEEEKYG